MGKEPACPSNKQMDPVRFVLKRENDFLVDLGGTALTIPANPAPSLQSTFLNQFFLLQREPFKKNRLNRFDFNNLKIKRKAALHRRFFLFSGPSRQLFKITSIDMEQIYCIIKFRTQKEHSS